MKIDSQTEITGTDECACRARRALLQASVGILVTGLSIREGITAGPEPAKLPPQLGDELWFPSWATESHAITVDEVPRDGSPVNAVPYDPVGRLLRERSRLNQILLVRVDPIALGHEPGTATEGILAYSGVCTHAACGVSEWNSDNQHLVCPCHASEFDPMRRGAVAAGPAPRPLPTLPIRIVERKLVVTGPFSASVGVKKT